MSHFLWYCCIVKPYHPHCSWMLIFPFGYFRLLYLVIGWLWKCSSKCTSCFKHVPVLLWSSASCLLWKLYSKSCPETRRVVSASLLYSMSCHHPVWCFFIVESNGFWDLYFLQLVSQRMVATLSLVCFSLFRQIEYVLWFDRGPIRFTRQSFTEQVAITTHYQPRHRGRHQVLPFGEFQISFKFFNILKEPMFSNWHAQLNKITTITSSKRMLMMCKGLKVYFIWPLNISQILETGIC